MDAPIIKFKTVCYSTKIEAVECIRETDTSVFLAGSDIRGKFKERREAKRSEWHQYHDSWEEARLYLLTREEGEVEDARRRLELANSRLGNVKGMKPPLAAV